MDPEGAVGEVQNDGWGVGKVTSVELGEWPRGGAVGDGEGCHVGVAEEQKLC